jgi:hypothetical protein
MEQRITKQMLDDALCAAREIGRCEGAEAERAAIRAEADRRSDATENFAAKCALLDVCEWLDARSKGGASR